MFNEYQWENYLKAGGDKIVKLFESFLNEDFKNIKINSDFFDTIKRLHEDYCPFNFINQNIKSGIVEFFADIKLGLIKLFFEKRVKYTCEKACLKVWNTLKKEYGLKFDSEIFECFTSNLAYFTTQLAKELPKIFIPYYFYGNFNIVTYIVETFGVELDVKKLPAKKDYKGRFMYYGKVCEAFQKFREDNNLSVAELWAFLYDYAPKCVGGLQYIKSELPKPKSAFLIGGAKEDVFLNSLNKKNNISLWQCNPDTRARDMIVMYLKTPHSRLDSVWRSVCEAFNDPFYWYYRCTYIGQPKKLNKKNCFTLKQMRKDSVLGELSIVKCNMQGVNGVELPPSVYNYIVKENRLLAKIKYCLQKYD